MARFFIDRPIFAWVISIIIMGAGGTVHPHPADLAIPADRASDNFDLGDLSGGRRRRPLPIR